MDPGENEGWIRTNRGRIAVAIGCLIPLAILVVLVVRSWVNLPWNDEWALAFTLQDVDAGTLSLADLAFQHGEHRILFPRIFMLATAWLSDWDTRATMAVGIAIAATSLVVLRTIARRTMASGVAAGALTVMTAWLLFSPVQWENWLWGWEIAWFLNVLGVVLTLWLLSDDELPLPRWVRLGLAAAAAILAMYSIASGGFAWLAGLVVLVIRRWSWPQIATWAGLAGVTVYIYSRGYTPVQQGSLVDRLLDDPIASIEYALTYLGAPLSLGGEQATTRAGGVIVAITIAAIALIAWRRPSRLVTAAPWIGLAVYTLAASATTASGRLEYGLIQALSSRYTTVAMLLLISAAALTVTAIEASFESWQLRGLFGVLGAAAVAGLIAMGWANGAAQMKVVKAERTTDRQCLDMAQLATDPCLTRFLPLQEQNFPLVEYVRERGFTGF